MTSRKASKTIVLYCEGETERDVLRPLLNRYLELREAQCGLQVNNLKGINHVYDKIGAVTKDKLRQRGVIAIFVLVDLCGSGFDTVEKVKTHLRTCVPRECYDRFHPHVAVHETEAWIFADDRALSDWLGHKVGPFSKPESINRQNPPAKQLRDLARSHARHRVAGKRLMAQRLFAKIDVEKIYATCPHFKDFVDDLRQTARR